MEGKRWGEGLLTVLPPDKVTVDTHRQPALHTTMEGLVLAGVARVLSP